ncbi:MAG: 16S rRNA (cytosine(1402)-N(4))-methyltransferase RsmH [Phycisphaerales bacterium]|nr:MAG: 16S rRNA (cytosine(1402)-N(4))-methyltransferase RsmH [Phycisphaerales bacterium]
MSGSTVEHVPVLAEALAEQIRLPQDGVMVDATIGHGGHSDLFGRTLGPKGVIVGLDVDNNAIRRAQLRLKDLACKVILIRSNFSDIVERVHEQGIDEVDFILADLGVCSAQLADVGMGLSLKADMPLDMRIDKRKETTAADIVNRADERFLADLIYKFGQDRASRRIARFIVRQREIEPITRTGQLAAVVSRALSRPGRKRKSRIHPATRTFQALRIAVNEELENLKALLGSAPELLKKTGRIAVISFHSLEDRLVKTDFKCNQEEGLYKIVTKKPIVPARSEITANRRARSAKLRIAERQ